MWRMNILIRLKIGERQNTVGHRRSKGCGLESCLIQNTRWKWVKAMPGLIPAPKSG